jgi:hypothetical protein
LYKPSVISGNAHLIYGQPEASDVMSEQPQYAWAAGFFDGEGCVSIQRQKRHTCLRIVMVQKDIRPIQRFREVFDLHQKFDIVSRPDRKHTYYRLTVSGAQAADVLRKMLPYLALKRDVAEVGLDLQADIERYNTKGRWSVIPDSSIQFREACRKRAHWLNTGRWAAATTKPEGLESVSTPVCDSLNCTDGKGAEVAEMTTRPN